LSISVNSPGAKVSKCLPRPCFCSGNMLSKNCCTDRRKHSRIAMSAVNIADNATAHTMRKSSIPNMRRRPARATHRTVTKAPAMATNAIDVETTVAPRESLACEVAIVGVKGQCRFCCLLGWKQSRGQSYREMLKHHVSINGPGKDPIQGAQRSRTISEKS
jgi:hypothetical protein